MKMRGLTMGEIRLGSSPIGTASGLLEAKTFVFGNSISKLLQILPLSDRKDAQVSVSSCAIMVGKMQEGIEEVSRVQMADGHFVFDSLAAPLFADTGSVFNVFGAFVGNTTMSGTLTIDTTTGIVTGADIYYSGDGLSYQTICSQFPQ